MNIDELDRVYQGPNSGLGGLSSIADNTNVRTTVPSPLDGLKGDLDKARTTEASALERLRKSYEITPDEEAANTANLWGVASKALLSDEPRGRGFLGSALAEMGSAFAKEKKSQFEAQRQNREKGDGIEYAKAADRLKALEGKYAAAITKGQTGSSQAPWIVITDKDKTKYRFNKLTGEKQLIPRDEAERYESDVKKYSDYLIRTGDPDWDENAHKRAAQESAARMAASGGSSVPSAMPAGGAQVALNGGQDQAAWAKQLEAEGKTADAEALRGASPVVTPVQTPFFTDKRDERKVKTARDVAQAQQDVKDSPGATKGVEDRTRAKAITSAEVKQSLSMKGVMDNLEAAEKILTGPIAPTASGIGKKIDNIAAEFGKSPEGAVQAKELVNIAAALTSNVPRMEGPQSDADRTYYAEVAGQLGDAGIPVDQRLAMLRQFKKRMSHWDENGKWHKNPEDAKNANKATPSTPAAAPTASSANIEAARAYLEARRKAKSP